MIETYKNLEKSLERAFDDCERTAPKECGLEFCTYKRSLVVSNAECDAVRYIPFGKLTEPFFDAGFAAPDDLEAWATTFEKAAKKIRAIIPASRAAQQKRHAEYDKK